MRGLVCSALTSSTLAGLGFAFVGESDRGCLFFPSSARGAFVGAESAPSARATLLRGDLLGLARRPAETASSEPMIVSSSSSPATAAGVGADGPATGADGSCFLRRLVARGEDSVEEVRVEDALLEMAVEADGASTSAADRLREERVGAGAVEVEGSESEVEVEPMGGGGGITTDERLLLRLRGGILDGVECEEEGRAAEQSGGGLSEVES